MMQTMTEAALRHQTWEYEPIVPCGIVVGVDGSPESIAAFNAAAAIARRRRVALHLVSVIPPFPAQQGDPGDESARKNTEELRIQLRNGSLRDLLKSVNADSGWTSEVVTGRPATMLTAIADKRGADLIIVGRSDHGVMDRIVGGETTLQIMRLSRIPVLAVPSESETYHSIVVATDFSASSVRAAKIASELMEKHGTLYLVYVEPPAEILPAGFTIPDDTRYPGDVVQWFRRLTESLRLPADVIVEPIVLNGKPVPAVLEFAERVGAELVAAGSHGHARLERFLLGSVSTGLARHAQCPVLVAPASNAD
jgi:nucleotide-binding universal stress UspA family protein